jgi:exonuclease SbcC
MRILGIKLAGFLSYGRPQSIDFDDVNVFCISGPNGAGKSSILDGIVYALYGKIPRYAGRRINTEEDVINHNSNELSISLKFKVQDKIYLVKRELVRGKSQQANIYEVGDRELNIPLGAKSNREVNAIIENILGMDYETFTRTIILPQNQIDRFLKPPSSEALSERRQVLQRLLGLEIYKEMKRLASQKYRDFLKEIQLIESRLTGDLSIYTRDYIKGIEKNLREKEVYLKSLEEKRMEFSNDVNKVREDLNLFTSFVSTMDNLKLVSQRLETLKVELEEVERLENILQLQRDALPWKTIVKEIQDKKDRMQVLEREKKLLKDGIEKLHTSLLLEEKNSQEYERFMILAEKLLKLVPISQDVKEIEREKVRLEQIKKDLDERETKLISLKKEIEEIEGLLAVYDSQIKDLKERQENKLVQWKEVEGIIERIKILKIKEKEIDGYLSRKTELERTKESLEKFLLENRPKLEKLNRELILLEERIEEYQLQKMVSGLSIGDKCPICGNTIEELPVFDSSKFISYEELLEDIKEKNSKRENIQKDIINREVTLAQITDELGKTHSILAETSAFKQQETQEVQNLLEKFFAKDYILDELFIREKIEKEKKELDSSLNDLEREKSIKTFQLAERKDSFNKEQTALENLKSQFITDREEFLKKEETVREEISSTNISWEEFLSRDFLREAQKLKEDYQGRLDLVNKNISVYKTRIESNLSRIEQVESEIEELSKSINILLEEESSLRKSLEPRCRTVNCPLDGLFELNIDTQYIQKVRRDYNELNAQENILKESLSQYRETLIRRSIDPDKIENDTVLKGEYEEKTAMLKRVEEEISQLSKEIGSLESQLKTAKGQLSVVQGLNSKRKSLEKLASHYKVIDDALSENKFPEFLISEIMESIIDRASIQLMNLTQGRYKFSLASDNSADIVINDNWYPSQRRKTYSLSGGESFLASIAIALAIAEEIRGKRAVDCLFIDEGFGSLDDVGLDSIVSALAQLENSGIMIGVVTHNKELASRFPYRIEVEKSEKGSIIRGGISA